MGPCPAPRLPRWTYSAGGVWNLRTVLLIWSLEVLSCTLLSLSVSSIVSSLSRHNHVAVVRGEVMQDCCVLLPPSNPPFLHRLCRCGVPTSDAGMSGGACDPHWGVPCSGLSSTLSLPGRPWCRSGLACGAGTKSWADRPNLLRLVLRHGTP